MNVQNVNEAAIVIALIAAIVALTVVTLAAGGTSVPSTGLRDLVILLGGALAGAKVPRP